MISRNRKNVGQCCAYHTAGVLRRWVLPDPQQQITTRLTMLSVLLYNIEANKMKKG